MWPVDWAYIVHVLRRIPTTGYYRHIDQATPGNTDRFFRLWLRCCCSDPQWIAVVAFLLGAIAVSNDQTDDLAPAHLSLSLSLSGLNPFPPTSVCGLRIVSFQRNRCPACDFAASSARCDRYKVNDRPVWQVIYADWKTCIQPPTRHIRHSKDCWYSVSFCLSDDAELP